MFRACCRKQRRHEHPRREAPHRGDPAVRAACRHANRRHQIADLASDPIQQTRIPALSMYCRNCAENPSEVSCRSYKLEFLLVWGEIS
jgi:hypothetical protein